VGDALFWLKKAWDWLKKYWKWILFPVGILLSVLSLLSRRRPDVVAPEVIGAQETKVKEQSRANKKLHKARADRDKKKVEIEKEHAVTISKLTRAQRDEMQDLQDDPKKLNQFLLDIGEQIRQ
jgi:hypothetical protein